MGKSKYAVGIDFGTLSGRALIVDISNGKEMASHTHEYTHGVIDEKLPGTQVRLQPDWALQDPHDYIEALKKAVTAVLKKSKVKPEDVIGLGIDFTTCTMLPVKKDGTPLCFLKEWRANPHAWVKLWKHHAAQPEATRLNEIARSEGYLFLDRYGGKISSEWFFPKAWQILNEAPEVYAAADRLLEASDWMVWQLTGVETRNMCAAGYKGMWSKEEGFPPNEFFKALDPRMENIVEEKMSRKLASLGDRAGGLSAQAAHWTGLKPGTAVAVANLDAHVSVPASTVVTPGRMVMIMGTSTCHMVLGTERSLVPGMCGAVRDGILPGYYGYEAGQSCVGDHFAWFLEHGVPASISAEAKKKRVTVHDLLESKAARLKPGESGLLALDWWNGNRSVLVDMDLTGVMVGMTLQTRPEEIYRALIESTAYGTRMIVETFEKHGVPVTELVATGGLSTKNKLLMQIYADVTGRSFNVAEAQQGAALGSAMHGAVAAGKAAGGYDSIVEAAERMARLSKESYKPAPENKRVYDRLYAEYQKLHDYFGRGENDVLKRLKSLKTEVRK